MGSWNGSPRRPHGAKHMGTGRVLLLVVLACAGLASPVSAQPLPEDNAGVDEYVPALPEPGGERPAGGGGSGGGRGGDALPPEVRRQLRGARDRGPLEAVGGSSGAAGPRAGGRSPQSGSSRPEDAGDESLPSAAGDAVLDGDRPWLALALLALALSAVAAGVVGLRRRRSEAVSGPRHGEPEE